MGTDIVNGKEAFPGNGIDDIALTDTITTTNLGSITHSSDGIFTTMAGIAQVCLTIKQAVADIADICALAH